MRTLTTVTAAFALFVGVLMASGCGGSADTTANKGNSDTQHDADYPVGPYGYTKGSVVADYKFLGKTPTAADTYAALPLRDIFLGEFHSDPAMRHLLIVGSAGWCVFCNEEAPNVEALATKFKDQGFRALTVLSEGHTRGEPAIETDIGDWTTRHKFVNTDMAIDPASTLFKYADASAFPLHILLDTSTMAIEWLCVGGSPGCDSETAVAQSLAQ